MPSPILVIGASGKTGRRVVDRLEQHALPLRKASRRSDTPFDWEDSTTWPAAISGCEVAYVAYTPDLAVPSAHAVIKEFVRIAESSGLKRVVLLSERNEARAQACEQLIIDSSLDWTILRPSWFMQNFNEGGFLEGVLAGEVSVPGSGAPEPFVDLDDVADVALAALRTDDHLGNIYEITGPDLLTWDQAIAQIAQISQRPVTFRRCSPEEFEHTLISVGIPEADASFTATLVAQILDGKNAQLCQGLQKALGREPRSFDQFCIDAAASGVWDD